MLASVAIALVPILAMKQIQPATIAAIIALIIALQLFSVPFLIHSTGVELHPFFFTFPDNLDTLGLTNENTPYSRSALSRLRRESSVAMRQFVCH